MNGTIHNAHTAIYHSPALHARNIDSKENQGLHAGAILGIVLAIIVGITLLLLMMGWAVRSHRAAYANSGNTRARTRRHVSPSHLEAGGNIQYPARSYGGSREKTPKFPGPRNGYASAKSSVRSSAPSKAYTPSHASRGRGPYADDTPFSAVPTMEARSQAGSSRRGSS